MSESTSKEKFIKTYANLPLPVRDEIIYIDEDKRPITWNVSYVEVSQDTPLGKKILEHLESLHIV